MGMIDEFDYQVALNCTGKNSPLKIARILGEDRSKIKEILNKLEQLDIVKI